MSSTTSIIIAVIIILLISSGIKYLYYKNWKLIYTTFETQSYFQIINKLRSSDIRYRTKTFIDRRSTMVSTKRLNQYDIYVKIQDEHIALQAIHSNN